MLGSNLPVCKSDVLSTVLSLWPHISLILKQRKQLGNDDEYTAELAAFCFSFVFLPHLSSAQELDLTWCRVSFMLVLEEPGRICALQPLSHFPGSVAITVTPFPSPPPNQELGTTTLVLVSSSSLSPKSSLNGDTLLLYRCIFGQGFTHVQFICALH